MSVTTSWNLSRTTKKKRKNRKKMKKRKKRKRWNLHGEKLNLHRMNRVIRTKRFIQ